MKLLRTTLLMLLILLTHFCQAQELFNENGIVLRYDGHERIGSRYDEYCKTTFDVYRVQATVINKNTDKAADIRAILNFSGATCNKIYSDNGPTGGEVISKVYEFNIPLQTKHQSPYWVNSFVSLGPDDEMTAYGEVEVKHGDPCPDPEPVFSYKLIPGQDKKTGNEPADVPGKTTADKTIEKGSSTIDTSFIVGEWTLVRVVITYKTGKVEEITDELSEYFEFEAGGKGKVIGHEYADDLKWVLSGNKIILNYSDGQSNTLEILKADDTTLIMKEYADKNNENGINYRVFTYNRGME